MNVNDNFSEFQYDEYYNFAIENNLDINEIEKRQEYIDTEKTHTIEKIVQQKQVIPAKYDVEGNLVEEEKTSIIETPIQVEEKYIEKELTWVRYFEVVEKAKPSLDDLKQAKRTEINKARDAAEQGGFEYLDKIFDSDQVSCQRISMAAQAMALAPEGSTITWTCQDNTTIDLNAEQLVGMVAALAQWSNECHVKATTLKEQIELAETEEELEKIQWNNSEVMK